MSISTARPLLEATEHRMTAADLAAMPTELPSGPVTYELDDGRIVPMSPPANQHGSIQAILCGELREQGEKCGHGVAYGEVGVILWRDPDRVVWYRQRLRENRVVADFGITRRLPGAGS